MKREKIFVAPLLAAVGGIPGLAVQGGLTALPMIQASGQAKEAAEQSEQQVEAMNKQTKALNKLAAKNPSVGPQMAQVMASEVNSIMSKNFSYIEDNGLHGKEAINETLTRGGRKIGEGVNTAGKTLAGGVGGGLLGTFGGLYAGRKLGFGGVKGALIGGALGTIGGSIMGHHSGKQDAQNNYSETDQRNFGMWNLKTIGGFVKDLGKSACNKQFGGHLAKQAVLWGGTGAVGAYAADKIITHDAKKNGIMPNQIQNQQIQQQYSEGSIMQRDYADVTGMLKSAASSSGKFLNNNKKSILGAVGLSAAMPLGMYALQRNNLKQQAQNQQIQQQYSEGSIMQRDYSIGQTVASGVRGLATTFGQIGNNAASRIGRHIYFTGINSGNTMTQKFGKWIADPKHLTAATVGLGAGGMYVAGKAMGAGEKVVRKTAETFDKNAFAYEKSQNQTIQ